MRGEDQNRVLVSEIEAGSPPHARGRRSEHKQRRVRERITPACAGKTRRQTCTEPHARDHPRMRGEDRRRSSRGLAMGGSPPHARGRRMPRVWIAWWTMDHPRMRGEDQQHRSFNVLLPGSPPHARGRPFAEGCGVHYLRITPACAGKTRPKRKCKLQCSGSPPHARGRLSGRLTRIEKERITPACAGKTCSDDVVYVLVGDHPRMRGEDARSIPSRMPEGGSPPHARGRRRRRRGLFDYSWITPACAGKTTLFRSPGRGFRDHPRMRGEDWGFS